MAAEKAVIVSKNYILILIITFVSALAFFQLIPIIPLFATKVIKIPESQVGIIVGAFSFSALISRPVVGYLLDNFYKRTVLLVALALFSVAFLTFLPVYSVLILVAVRFIQGITWSTVTTSTMTTVMGLIPKARSGEGMGYYSLAMPIAMVIGPALALELLDLFGNYNMLFIQSAVLGSIAFLCTLMLDFPKEKPAIKKFSLKIKDLYAYNVRWTAVMQFCYSFAHGGIMTFIPLYALQRAVDKPSFFFMAYAVGIIVTRLFSRRVFDKHGPAPLVTLGFIMNFVGILLLTDVDSTLKLAICGAVYGVGAGVLMPAFSTMSMVLVNAKDRGKASATVLTASDVGMGGGALVLGFLAEGLSYNNCYYFSLIMPVIALIVFWAFGYKDYKKNVI